MQEPKKMKVRVDTITIHPYLEKIYRAHLIRELAESMKRVGQIQPVVLNSKNQALAGKRRIIAGALAGLTELDAIIIDPEDEELFILDSNRVNREKSTGETIREMKELKKLWGKPSGYRSDKDESLSEEDRLNTIQRIVSYMKESQPSQTWNETKVKRLLKIGEVGEDLAEKIDNGMAVGKAYDECIIRELNSRDSEEQAVAPKKTSKKSDQERDQSAMRDKLITTELWVLCPCGCCQVFDATNPEVIVKKPLNIKSA